ncbi:hypothetical protein TCAL_14541 [Tigriopus californicus]|uniref:Uncharacterized protein n=1 Tax=Tigriopus californicus TaxID=6832 RepID=A0A553PAM8_TIGCA|nr:hypothetical protein TCAL_14541 [Tigriopus californicus]
MKTLKKQCLELEETVQASREVEGEGSKKEKELKEAEVEVKASKKAVETSKNKWTDREAEEASLKMEINDLQKAISDEEDQLRACDEVIAGFETECTHLVEAVLEAKEALKAQKEVAAEAYDDAEKLVQHMQNKYKWIGFDRKIFSESGSVYDFKATDSQEAGKKIQKLEETKEKLERTVNMRAILPGTKAKLQSPEGMDVLDEVEASSTFLQHFC